MSSRLGGVLAFLPSVTSSWLVNTPCADSVCGPWLIPYDLVITETHPLTCADANVEPNESRQQATVATAAVVSGTVCGPTDVDCYRVTTSVSEAFAVELAFGAIDLDLRLYDDAGRLLASATDSANPERIGLATLAAGDHFACVDSFRADPLEFPADYTLSVSAPSLVVGGGSSGTSSASSAGAGSSAGTRSSLQGPSSSTAASSGPFPSSAAASSLGSSG